MAVKKDAKSEFIDAYKKMFSKEQLKDMGQFIADESKKPGNQAVLAVAPMGKIPKIAKGAKAVGKAIKNSNVVQGAKGLVKEIKSRRKLNKRIKEAEQEAKNLFPNDQKMQNTVRTVRQDAAKRQRINEDYGDPLGQRTYTSQGKMLGQSDSMRRYQEAFGLPQSPKGQVPKSAYNKSVK